MIIPCNKLQNYNYKSRLNFLFNIMLKILVLNFLILFFSSCQSSPSLNIFTPCPNQTKVCDCTRGFIPCNLFSYSGEEEYFGCIKNLTNLISSCCPNRNDWYYNSDSFYNSKQPRLTCMKKTEVLIGIQKLSNNGTTISCAKTDFYTCHESYKLKELKVIYLQHDCRHKSKTCIAECFEGWYKNKYICIADEKYNQTINKRFG